MAVLALLAACPAQAAGPKGRLACTNRRGRLTFFRGDGKKRRTAKVKGEDPRFSPSRRLVAFHESSGEDQNAVRPKLVLADRNGKNVRTIVSLPSSAEYSRPPDFDPLSWAGDSTRMTYTREFVSGSGEGAQTRVGLFIANVDGGEQRVPLHREGFPATGNEVDGWVLDRGVAFSKDSRTIAFGGVSPGGLRGVWLAEALTGAARLLYALPARAQGVGVEELAWSPDGGRLLVVDGARGTFVVNGETGLATASGGDLGGADARWSPDGTLIADIDAQSPGGLTRVVTADMSSTTDPVRSRPKHTREQFQLWSPDGRSIAFDREWRGRGSQKALRRAARRMGTFVVPASGGKARKIIKSSAAPKGSLALRNSYVCSDWAP